MHIVHLFVIYVHFHLCHLFSSSWCQVLAATSARGSSWTFLFTFKKTVDIKINVVDVKAESDSEAYVNLMDEHQFKALFNRSARKPI